MYVYVYIYVFPLYPISLGRQVVAFRDDLQITKRILCWIPWKFYIVFLFYRILFVSKL